MLGHELAGVLVGFVEHAFDLLIYLLGGVLRNLPALNQLATQEDLLVPLTDRHETDDFRHTEASHHLPGQRRGSLDVVARAGRDLFGAEDHLLGHTPAEEHAQLPFEPLLCVGMAILLRETRRNPQGAPTRYDGDLMDRIQTGQSKSDHRVAGLVVRRELSFRVREHHAAALGPQHDFVPGLFEVSHAHLGASVTGSEKSGLVADVGQVRSAQARSALGHDLELDVTRQRQLLRVDPQNPLPSADVGKVHHDLAVETAGPQECGIEHVRSVGRGQQNHTLIGLEAVHFNEQGIEGLFALVMSPTQAGSAVPSDGIDLVDEDNAGSVRLALLEQVPDP